MSQYEYNKSEGCCDVAPLTPSQERERVAAQRYEIQRREEERQDELIEAEKKIAELKAEIEIRKIWDA